MWLILPRQGKGFLWYGPFLLFSGEKTWEHPGVKTQKWRILDVFLEIPQGNPIKAESWLQPPAVTNAI